MKKVSRPSVCSDAIPNDPAPVPLTEPRVVALFRGPTVHPDTVLPLEGLLAPYRLEHSQIPPLEAREMAATPAHRLLQAVPLERLERLDRATSRSRYRGGASRTHIANTRILTPPQGLKAERFAALLNGLPEVALAYVERAVGRPCDDADCEDLSDLSADQRWLNPAPEGLSARFAWGLSGGRGESIPFVLIDKGWNVEDGVVCHCDLNGGVPVAWGSSGNTGDKQHGMASLGIVVARHDRGGILGLAPNASSVAVCSYAGSPGALTYIPEAPPPDTIPAGYINPWNALAVAIDHLALLAGTRRPVPGVILLELQIEAPSEAVSAWSPAEVDPALRALIGVASALGITVIEAAGNGRTPVADTFLPGALPTGAKASPAGAILVGAADTSRRPAFVSNTGPLIDCFGQGEGVPSLSTIEEEPRTLLTTSFSGTSSASAIVAGAALAAQGLYRATRGRTLGPEKLREHLRASGTPAKNELDEDSVDRIGLQPNLARFAEIIGRSPVYFQDFPGHNGQWHAESVGLSSPDILVTTSAPSAVELSEFALNGALNSGGGVSAASLSGEVHLTARLANLGGEALSGVSIALFAAPANPPSDATWTPIGTLSLPSLSSSGRSLSDTVIWTPPAEMSGEILILALATSPCFPVFLKGEPPKGGPELLEFVQQNPRVTFRRCVIPA